MLQEVEQPQAAREPKGKSRIGFYLWGGPGTVRITQVKYFNPRFDMDSMMRCYDYDYLARAKDLFGITDCWVTYSWGFSDEVEQEDRRFILDRLENFQKLGIRTHAYIQGPNLVYDNFADKDWWALDERNRPVMYYRGRRMTSIHNQEFVNYVVDKVHGLAGKGFDGVYMDNVQHGQLGVPMPNGELPFVFCGDYSAPARAHFRAETGHDIPTDLEADLDLTREYLEFRIKSNTAFIKRVGEAAQAGGLEYGTNFYDPKFDPSYIYAIDLERTTAVQDYILFENHSLPREDGSRHNGYIEDLMESYNITKPVFVVSYHNGVGMAPQFTQAELDNLFSEAQNSTISLCLKGGEFTTNGIWHCLYLEELLPPLTNKSLERQPLKNDMGLMEKLLQITMIRSLLKRYYNPLFRVAFEWRMLRILINLTYDMVLK